jgi:hypothetical protein
MTNRELVDTSDKCLCAPPRNGRFKSPVVWVAPSRRAPESQTDRESGQGDRVDQKKSRRLRRCPIHLPEDGRNRAKRRKPENEP